jgi:hypothetical protein
MKSDEIVEYLISIGFNRVGQKDTNVFKDSVFIKGNVEISYGEVFRSTLSVFVDGKKVYDINEGKRIVMNVQYPGNETKTFKTIGISHPVTIEEVKTILRDVKLDYLLNG